MTTTELRRLREGILSYRGASLVLAERMKVTQGTISSVLYGKTAEEKFLISDRRRREILVASRAYLKELKRKYIREKFGMGVGA